MFKSKLLFLFFFLTLATANADDMLLLGVGGGAGGGCTECTGGLTFAGYFESDGDVTNGTPCGCSAGDETGTAYDSCTIHDGYIDSADAGKYFGWTVANSGDIINGSAGSVLIHFTATTVVNTGRIFSYEPDSGNDRVVIYENSSSDLVAYHEGNSTGNILITCTSSNLSNGSTYYVVLRWRTGSSNPSLLMEVYASDESSIDSCSTNTDLTAFAVTDGADVLEIGNSAAGEADTNILKFKVWDTYAGAPTCGSGTCAAE